ncbi:lamin tail domain-containing protein [candidate division KSB1 bacterium]|nr:lamin tail domain-containing protein [candidate division KSB1 bacterium]
MNIQMGHSGLEYIRMLLMSFLVICLFFIFTPPSFSQIYINEIMASNVTTNPDMVDFDDYSDWIELYNAGKRSVNLEGYYLTDNFNNPTKWQFRQRTVISAKGYLRLWADGFDEVPGRSHIRPDEPHEQFLTQSYHLNFKLSKAGEQIGLFDANGVAVDTFSYSLQKADVSYGRNPDGAVKKLYFGEPTPGSSNKTEATLSNEQASLPVINMPAGFYDESIVIEITTASPSATIHYTLNGEKPTSVSPVYFNPLNIDTTTVLRARAFEPGKLPGELVTHTFLIGEPHRITTISIAAFPETLFGNELGIYSNILKSREIPISFEFFEPSGEPGFHVNAGLRLSGQASFEYPQKPLTISVDDRFVDDEMKYQIFPNRDINSFQDIYFRNSGTPDNRQTLFRDALQHCLVINKMDLDCQAYRPAATFINGEYWGIYNLREKINANYLAAHHNVDPNNLDLLEYDFDAEPVVIEGDVEQYNQLLDFLENHDLSVTENYRYIESQIDINEFMNYVITQVYCNNINWPYTNCRWWRERKENSKWRWILLDLDFGFGTVYPGFTSEYSDNALELATSAPGSVTDTYPWSTIIFRKLLENENFKNEFIQRFASYLNTIFQPDRVLGIVDSLKAQIKNEMVRHIDRWNDDPEVIYSDPPIQNIIEWNNDVEIMRQFAIHRTDFQRQHIKDFFGLDGTISLNLDVVNPGSGSIWVNHVRMPDQVTGYYYKNIPIILKAVPRIGYRFVRWEGYPTSTSDSISIVLPLKAVIKAVFEPTDLSRIPTKIASNTTLSLANSPYLAEGDVVVDTGVTLKVEPGVEIQMPEAGNIIVHGNIILQGNAENPISIVPNTLSGVKKWGALCIENATAASSISYVTLIGASKGLDLTNHIGAISAYHSDVTLDHVTIPDAPFPVFIQYGNAVVKNCSLHSEKTCDLINIKYATSALVENCTFRGNDSFDTDAIDYDQISIGIIRNNQIYNFYGDNSDGIDLGEASKNILIENNLILNCTDKAISVGQASTTTVRHNVIVNCAQGVGVKDDDSYARIENNTFYGNNYAVASFEKNIGAGGGNADIINCILSKSTIAPFLVDALSTLKISYSLSDTDILPGESNLLADPVFINNFQLGYSSLAINSGDPGSPVDPDGSRADIGAFYYKSGDQPFVIINEIHYNPANGDDYEFIELLNAGASALQLENFELTGGVHFKFPANSKIAPDEYIIITANVANYKSQAGQVFQWNDERLSDSWADIRLLDDNGRTIDFVSYSKANGWPSSANGNGPSLELRAPDLENIYTANWRASYENGGTPGRPNSIPTLSKIYINEFLTRNTTSITDEFGDHDDWIEIYNANDQSIDLGGLYLTDDFSNETKYQIPPTNPDLTTIKPHGYLIFWADEQSSQGELHVNFKLSTSNEQIGLVQLIDDSPIFIDQVYYSSQKEDVSIGRTDDGATSWKYCYVPTPVQPNSIPGIFTKGILVVNGVSFALYGDVILQPYENRAFWGNYSISFWDCFGDQGSYPSTLPAPLGFGEIPLEILHQFSTVIWLGNNYGGDLQAWNATPIYSYLQSGGNVILLTRMGTNFIDEELASYLGIEWKYQEVSLFNCISSYPGLIDMTIVGEQSFNDLFGIELRSNESTLLFKNSSSDEYRGMGVWHMPTYGGAYNRFGGQFIFISGRPYRFDSAQLRTNMQFILDEILQEDEPASTSDLDGALKITEFSLAQNYPNPFNPSTTIRFDIPHQANVSLRIYNIRGRLVRKIFANHSFATGRYQAMWDGKDDAGRAVGTGQYFCKFDADGFSSVRKIVLTK